MIMRKLGVAVIFLFISVISTKADEPKVKPPPGPFDPSKLEGFQFQRPAIGHGAPMPPHPSLQAFSELIKRFKPLEDKVEEFEGKLEELSKSLSEVSASKEAEDSSAEETWKDALQLLQLQNNNLNARIANLEAYVYELRKETGLLAKKTANLDQACDTTTCPDSTTKSTQEQDGPPVLFSVFRKTSYSTEDSVIPYDEQVFDSSNGFDLQEGTYTVPVSGVYSVGFYARNFDNSDTFVQVRANGHVIADARQTIDASFGITGLVTLEEGDVLDTYLSSGGVFSNANRFVYFTAHLLAASASEIENKAERL